MPSDDLGWAMRDFAENFQSTAQNMIETALTFII